MRPMRSAPVLLLGFAACVAPPTGSTHRSWTVADVEWAIVAASASTARKAAEGDAWDTIQRDRKAQTIMRRVQPCAAGQAAEIEVHAVARLPTDMVFETHMGHVELLDTTHTPVSARVRVKWTVRPGPPGRAVLAWRVEVSETLRPLPLFTTLLTDIPAVLTLPGAMIVAESGQEEIATGRWHVRELPVRAEDEGAAVPPPLTLLFRVEPRDPFERPPSPKAATTRSGR